jgi:hypothetical protein
VLSSSPRLTRPCVHDGGDGVGRGLVALLVLAEMARHGAVGGLGFEGLAVGGDEDGCHEAEGAEALSDDVRLNISVVVLYMLAGSPKGVVLDVLFMAIM